MQAHDKHLYPVAFWFQKLIAPEQNYQIMELELLPIVKATSYWQYYHKGALHPIQIYTDHQNLKYFNTLKQLNSKLVR